MCSKMMKVARPMHRRPLALVLVCSALVFSLVILAAQYSLFSGIKGYDANTQDVKTLYAFQHEVKQCVQRNGLGLIANIVDQCKIILAYPEGTNSTWYNEQFKIYEPLEYTFDVCASLLLWEQYRNMTTILTREYLDSRPDGWLTYAAKRIAQLGVDKCYNLTLCEEHLSLVLPSRPPFHPRQFETCAVVGNSGDLLKNEFGHEIDDHDAVIRDNEAPVNKIKDLILEGEALRSSLFQVVPSIDARQNYYWKYAKHVGMKRNFRLMARGVARNMPKVVNGSADEVLIIKSVIHRDFNTMIKELPNPVYLFQGVVLRRGAKGTGMKSIELALSMCDTVDIYGFTVDPGYTEWTRYFSSPRKGHNPLQGRAYYQLLECLGVIRIHSPMREQRKQDWSVVPSRAVVNRAHTAARRLKGSQNEHPDSVGPFSACKVWASATSEVGPVSGSPDMSPVRRSSNYSKWELLKFSDLRNEAREHHKTMKGVAMYKIDGNKLEDLVCVKHPLDSEI